MRCRFSMWQHDASFRRGLTLLLPSQPQQELMYTCIPASACLARRHVAVARVETRVSVRGFWHLARAKIERTANGGSVGSGEIGAMLHVCGLCDSLSLAKGYGMTSEEVVYRLLTQQEPPARKNKTRTEAASACVSPTR
ncbi:hypothetical protein CAOG_009412 [Capsaspora owczarzaki ATCC 30864]|uniref:Uncharacterized protein n=1 Tax=Capsaspora owczarzaki (strain ATCC 30864) TaxID=595528 RepID=A0A0D2U3Y7_CAPO3|nr:hypothetical protein CAOG_009412 [Capsaspora owczarzaki ATCC 30864]